MNTALKIIVAEQIMQQKQKVAAVSDQRNMERHIYLDSHTSAYPTTIICSPVAKSIFQFVGDPYPQNLTQTHERVNLNIPGITLTKMQCNRLTSHKDLDVVSVVENGHIEGDADLCSSFSAAISWEHIEDVCAVVN